MTFKSVFPPVCVKGPISRKWYVIADGVWHPVTRNYSWIELEKMWERVALLKVELPKNRVARKEWAVAGSRGNTYSVVRDNNRFSCSCPAHSFGRGKDCKHILKIKSKL